MQAQTRQHLLGQPGDHPDVRAARVVMLADPRLHALIEELLQWPGEPLARHNQAGHPLHRLVFLATIGLRRDDPGVDSIINRVLMHQHADGPFQILVRPWRRGDRAEDSEGGVLTWALCDAPLVLWAMCMLGADEKPALVRAAEHLTGLIRGNGWPCAAGEGYGANFRGPGRKGDPCPYATLLALRALAAYGSDRLPDSSSVDIGIETLLYHWEAQTAGKLYLFGIGTEFRKPKFPLVWYDILHMVDVLSQYESARRDPRYRDMLHALMSQADETGRFTARSMYKPWAGWEFANKKAPSPAITLTAWRAAGRG